MGSSGGGRPGENASADSDPGISACMRLDPAVVEWWQCRAVCAGAGVCRRQTSCWDTVLIAGSGLLGEPSSGRQVTFCLRLPPFHQTHV